jgi:ribose transport system substrate-binding protein
MKHILRVLIILFAFLSLGSFLGSFLLVRGLYPPSRDDKTGTLDYHFILYLPDNRNSFFTGIIRGAETAAAELNAAVSIHSIDPAKNELEMSSYTGADGIIVCPYLDDSLARRQLEKLRRRQIPTVIINHNIPNEQPWPFIGTNNFDVGRRIGAMAGRLNSGRINLAVVYSDKSPGFYGERELVEMGITAALGDRLAAPVLGLRTNLNPLDAEEVCSRLFRTNSRVNTLVFTDPNDTIAVAQTLIDMNMVGRIQIIGFGDDPEIAENIRKGIIACSIVTNPERIGYEAVRSLGSLKQTGYTSASIDTGVEFLTRENLP